MTSRLFRRDVFLAIVTLANVTLFILFYNDSLPSPSRLGLSSKSSPVVYCTRKPPEEHLATLEQTDPDLIKVIRDHFLVPPSALPYNLWSAPDEDPGVGHSFTGQGPIVRRLLNNMKNGIFVESGAYDGESFSNTLVLERDYNWRGLLVEPSPFTFPRLRSKHRNAWSINACLSRTTKYRLEEFNHDAAHPYASKVGEPWDSQVLYGNITKYNVSCFPFYSLLLAMNMTTIDYWSLDVESLELDVLQTIPFNMVHIKVISVEYNMVKDGPEALRRFIESKGYVCAAVIGMDFIFAHKSLGVPEHCAPETP